ncbi:conserved protein of unknown function [Candidatus Hydrogenisulfobacillus filiaventi]|uniref:Uncharacterized protein n=1 Tax=Candidatus Hydrogenisulfobacillus filiaventi TaxID=2707344 RepID=A0A6F8ZD04_9FIRM|nr:hypothetical protein [Bacillota bacterium]CAB1127811.1 conserved protein of unknown function [Candidatus Hydrogenisulfobacillus filiaventi]
MAIDQVTPGPYPSGVPTPTEVDCIWVDKVFGSCQQDVTINATTLAVTLNCTSLTSVTCGTPTCTFLNAVPGSNDINTLSWLVSVPIDYTCNSGATGSVTATAQVVASLYNPPGTTPECLPFSVSCAATVVPSTISGVLGTIYATANVCLELKTVARVQLLVPTYGYCVEPPCQVAAVCPSPFPPQQTPTTTTVTSTVPVTPPIVDA